MQYVSDIYFVKIQVVIHDLSFFYLLVLLTLLPTFPHNGNLAYYEVLNRRKNYNIKLTIGEIQVRISEEQ
jgi:hypothetical protein